MMPARPPCPLIDDGAYGEGGYSDAWGREGGGGGGGSGIGGSRQQDSLGLPSEASLFRDLPDFLRDTTDE